jgi:hypothetical protein
MALRLSHGLGIASLRLWRLPCNPNLVGTGLQGSGGTIDGLDASVKCSGEVILPDVRFTDSLASEGDLRFIHLLLEARCASLKET